MVSAFYVGRPPYTAPSFLLWPGVGISFFDGLLAFNKKSDFPNNLRAS